MTASCSSTAPTEHEYATPVPQTNLRKTQQEGSLSLDSRKTGYEAPSFTGVGSIDSNSIAISFPYQFQTKRNSPAPAQSTAVKPTSPAGNVNPRLARRFSVISIVQYLEILDSIRHTKHLTAFMVPDLAREITTSLIQSGVSIAKNKSRLKTFEIKTTEYGAFEVFGTYIRANKVRMFAGRVEHLPEGWRWVAFVSP